MLLPQKIVCAVVAILNTFWMIQFVRTSLPQDSKNPGQHIEMLISIVSQVFKCVMFKTMWMEQDRFVQIANFILNSEIPIWQNKWLLKGGTSLNWLLQMLYTMMGICSMGWMSSKISDKISENSNQYTWSYLLSSIVTGGKYNFFLSNATILPANVGVQENPYSSVNILIGIRSFAELLHRYPKLHFRKYL